MAFQWWPVQQAFTDPKYWHLWRGLVGAWPAIGRGNRWPDVSPSLAHGVLTNMSPSSDWIATKGGGALEFTTGGSEYVNCGSSLVLSAYPFTMAGWCERKGGANYIVSCADNTTTTAILALFIGVGGAAGGIIHNGTQFNTVGGTTLTIGERYFLTFVCRSATDREIYVNGESDGTATASATFPTGLNNTAIGSIQRSTPFYGDSIVQCPMVWSRDLSVPEIKLLYQADSEFFSFWPGMFVRNMILHMPVAMYNYRQRRVNI